MKTIVAIGGYEHQDEKAHEFNTPIEIDQEILRLSGKKKPNALFIPTASSDSSNYIDAVSKIYNDILHCPLETLRLIKEKPSQKEVQSKINWADVIYVGGGNTLKMMKKWRSLGVDKMLKRAYEQGKILCGASAGSICWFDYGVSDSLHFYNKKETQYVKVRGLGFLKGVHNPHHESKAKHSKHRMKGVKEVMLRSKEKCIGIPDGCAVVFEGNDYRVIGKPEVSQVWFEKGKYIEKRIPRAGKVDEILG